MFKKAFTLLEIMTVLLVIGIITAISMPMLLNLQDDADVFETLRSKAEKDINDAIILSLIRHKDVVKDYSDVLKFCPHQNGSTNFSQQEKNNCMMSFFQSTLSYDLSCDTSSFTKYCWPNWTEESDLVKELNSRAVQISPPPAGFLLSNNMYVGMIYDETCSISSDKTGTDANPIKGLCGYLLVDTNGKKKPNKYNEDQIIFELGKQKASIEYYTSAATCPEGQTRNSNGECVSAEGCVKADPAACPCTKITTDECSCLYDESTCECGYTCVDGAMVCNIMEVLCSKCVTAADGTKHFELPSFDPSTCECGTTEDGCACKEPPAGCVCPVCENNMYSCKGKQDPSICECGVSEDGCSCKEPPDNTKCYICNNGAFELTSSIDPATCPCGAKANNCSCYKPPELNKCYDCKNPKIGLFEEVPAKNAEDCECGLDSTGCKCKTKPEGCYKCENGEYVPYTAINPSSCECGVTADGCDCVQKPSVETCPCPVCMKPSGGAKPYYDCSQQKIDPVTCPCGAVDECNCLSNCGGCAAPRVLNGSSCCTQVSATGAFKGANTCERCESPYVAWDSVSGVCVCPPICDLNQVQDPGTCECKAAKTYGCTDEKATVITSAVDLANIGLTPTALSGSYCLVDNIDLEDYYDEDKTDWEPIGSLGYDNTTNTGTPFTGKFDGNGHIIDHLNIEKVYNLGLFERIGANGKIFNLALKNVTINGKSNIGAFAASNLSGEISNCYATGEINGESYVGGIVGNNAGTVKNSFSDASIGKTATIKSGAGTINVSSLTRGGGLIGVNSGTVENSYFSGNINGTDIIGGLIGENIEGATVKYCYSRGLVTANTRKGGLYGVGTRATKCYWDITVSSQEAASYNLITGIEGKISTELKVAPSSSVYVDWDESLWCFKCDNYPVLVDMPTDAPESEVCTNSKSCSCEPPELLLNGICQCPICPEGQDVKEEDKDTCTCSAACTSPQAWDSEDKRCECPSETPYFNPVTHLCEACSSPRNKWDETSQSCKCGIIKDCTNCFSFNSETCECDIEKERRTDCGGCSQVCRNNNFECNQPPGGPCVDCTEPDANCAACVSKEVPDDILNCPCSYECNEETRTYRCIAPPTCTSGQCLDPKGCTCINSECNAGYCHSTDAATGKCLCTPQLTVQDCQAISSSMCLSDDGCSCKEKPDCLGQNQCPSEGGCSCLAKPDCSSKNQCPNQSDSGCSCVDKQYCVYGTCQTVDGCSCVSLADFPNHCKLNGQCPSADYMSTCLCAAKPDCSGNAEGKICNSLSDFCVCDVPPICPSGQKNDPTDVCKCIAE